MTVSLIGYYTITPVHCGTGQAAGGVDLPIAREAHTQHPILPATSVKGAIRERFGQDLGRDSTDVERWFGPELDTSLDGAGTRELAAGSITFGEGRVLAFPVRALHTAFCYVTCPLVLERFERDLRAHGLERFWSELPGAPRDGDLWGKADVLIGPEMPVDGALVLEDLAFDPGSAEVAESPIVKNLGSTFGLLLPDNETGTCTRLARQLVVLRDDYFADLVRRTAPVQPRVRLDENKTTTRPVGNLWYEEHLPADTLLASFVRDRVPRSRGFRHPSSSADDTDFFAELRRLTARPLQIGGNETVGQGLCLWHEGAQHDG